MYFEYESYKVACFGAPLFGAISFTIGILIYSSWLIYVIKSRKRGWGKICLYLLMLIGAGITLGMEIGALINGGIYLSEEKETDAVEIQGEISNIKGLGEFSFPSVKGDYLHEEKNGYEFTIGEVKCKAVLKGSLEVGDYVTVKYLPKSGYVLYIAETDRNAADIE